MTNNTDHKHPLDHALNLEPLAPGQWQGKTSPAYANMVGPFGGTTGATLLNAILSHEELLGAPISLTVNFAAPVADGPFDIIARPVRTNRSTQHWWVEQVQNDQVVAFATAVTAVQNRVLTNTAASSARSMVLRARILVVKASSVNSAAINSSTWSAVK